MTVTVSSPTRTVTVTAPAEGGVGAPRQVLEFGYMKALTRTGTHYEMRFDPAWFLTGVTANTAAAEDGAAEPGQPVPNDSHGACHRPHEPRSDQPIETGFWITVSVDSVRSLDQQYRA